MSDVKLPTNQQRTVEIGRTGTGKTVGGLFILSNYDLRDPWVVMNFKDDEHIESIENTREIDFDYIPGKRDEGLFILNVAPGDCRPKSRLEKSRLEVYLQRLWERQNVGIFVDEARMIGSNDAFDMCLTQGRSRCIPMIICTQKPSWCSTFVFSEASFIQVFDLNDNRDIQRVEDFVPVDWDKTAPLKKHQSFWYDVSEDLLFRFNPVPNMNEIRDRFSTKLRPQRVRI